MSEHKLDLLASIKKSGERAPEIEAPEAPLVPRELALELTYVDPEGKKHTATLTSRIMDGDEMRVRDRAVGSLVGGSWEALSPHARSRCHYLGTVAVQLRDPPAWVRRWVAEDDDLLFSIGMALEDHSDRYFRRYAREGEEAEVVRRVDLRPLDAP